jgi:hypothetical protein
VEGKTKLPLTAAKRGNGIIIPIWLWGTTAFVNSQTREMASFLMKKRNESLVTTT